MNEEEKMYTLAIVSIVAIVIIVMVTMYSLVRPQYKFVVSDTSVGKAYNNPGFTPTPEADNCLDSDGGKTYGTWGTLTGIKDNKRYKFEDSCINDLILKERFCTGNNPAYEYVNCQATSNTPCQKGKCGY